MKHGMLWLAPILLLALTPARADAKGTGVGIYGVIEEVTFDDNGPAPQVIRIKGVFLIPRPMSSGDYQPPQRGYLCFRLPAGREQAARSDWEQLKVAAGSGRIVGFTDYWEFNETGPIRIFHALEVRVRSGKEGAPDVYPHSLNEGVTKPDDRSPDYEKKILDALKRYQP